MSRKQWDTVAYVLRHGWAWILAGVMVLVMVGLSMAYVRSTTSEGNPLFWPEKQATLNLRLLCPPTQPLQSPWGPCWDDVARDAAEDWNAAGSQFRFHFEAPTLPAQQSCDEPDFLNTVLWASQNCGMAFGDAVAITAGWNLADGTIGDMDVLFDTARPWSAYTGSPRFPGGEPVYDLHRVAMHEFGHVLGLNHPDDHGQSVPAIMHSSNMNGTIERLQPDDIAGVRAIYGVQRATTTTKGTLENPGRGTTMSGVGVISGWKCDAGELTVRFNGGAPLPLLYGSVRTDVRDAGACPHAEVGFVALWNWGNLGDGQHTAVVYDDGREFTRSTFRVVTTGEAFLPDAEGQCVVPDFPAPGENALFTWSTGTQHLELTDVGRHIRAPSQRQHLFDGRWDFRLAYQGTCRIPPPATFWIDITQSSLIHIADDSLASIAVLETGQLEGQLSIDAGPHVFSLTGLLTGRTGEGVWFDFRGCYGTWTATKR